MLDGLALGRRGAARDSATDKDDELFDAGSLEIAEVRDVRSVGEDDGIRSFGSGLENKQGGDLHSCLRWIKGCVTMKRLNGRRGEEASAPGNFFFFFLSPVGKKEL